MALDGQGNLYVANGRNDTISIYPFAPLLLKGPNGGAQNLAPQAIIQGPSTNLTHVIGLALG